jgi:hypothetical protein
MRRHWNRTAYFVVDEGILPDRPELFGDSRKVSEHFHEPASRLKFGRMFKKADKPKDEEAVIEALKELGDAMNLPAADDDSEIPAGYTYLGQFIAHDITFDKTKGFGDSDDPENWRSPQIDLDSVYLSNPKENPQLYADAARLKIGKTYAFPALNREFPVNDLARDDNKIALIGDERNDENLAVAQTHVAFINFHNKVVDRLEAAGYPSAEVFEAARERVVRHFQWIILHDFLPRLIDDKVLAMVMAQGPVWIGNDQDLFMPLEFSCAAFRFGHSMVRSVYQWNRSHSTEAYGKGAHFSQLFDQTAFSGDLGRRPRLQSDWIIDWRRFFEFPDEFGYKPAITGINMARKINTNFNLHLDQISAYPHDVPSDCKSITVRNLLRGFSLSLATAEDVVPLIVETPLTFAQLTNGPEPQAKAVAKLEERIPLWFYILKESEVKGEKGRLGPVGSRIVAETFVGLIKRSGYSILDGWEPKEFGRTDAVTGELRFDMVDLLHFADVVNPDS